MVGWTRLKVHGKPGQRITVRHGEMLNPDGTLYTVNLRGATATDFFDLAGTGDETLEPRFTFHGFRYVEVQGLDYQPEPDCGDRHRRAYSHAADGPFRMFQPPGQPALP